MGPQILSLGGEAKEEECEDVVLDEVDLVVEEEVDAVVDQVVDKVALGHMILWLVIAVGCVAIWPATVPKIGSSHREVETLSLPEEDSLDPAKKGQGTVEEEGRLGLVQWGSFMMKRDMNIPLTIKVNCTSPTNLRKLLPSVRMRRKKIKIQKTKKVLCQCGHCWCCTLLGWNRTKKRK